MHCSYPYGVDDHCTEYGRAYPNAALATATVATLATIGERPLASAWSAIYGRPHAKRTVQLLATASLHPRNNAPAGAGRRLAEEYVPATGRLISVAAWRRRQASRCPAPGEGAAESANGQVIVFQIEQTARQNVGSLAPHKMRGARCRISFSKRAPTLN
jgi:hypothetical protein